MGRRKQIGATMLPRNVTKEILPSGSVRYRFRRKGFRATLPGHPDSDEFQQAYAKALLGERDKPKLPRRTPTYSMAHLIVTYMGSPEWAALSPTTRRVYGRFLERIREKHGTKDARSLTPTTVRQLRNSIASPHMANRYLSILRILMQVACEAGWRDDNPCRDVSKIKVKTKGFHSWTDGEIAAFLSRWGEGTRERLAMLLLLDTGQRPSDVCRMQRQHITDGTIAVEQHKTKAKLHLVLGPMTLAEIDRTAGDMMLILTTHGRPYSRKGFQQWFSRAATEAGLPHCSAHGLRKARARMLAERGATTEQIKSITGHSTTQEVDRYVRAASQKRLAAGVAATIGALDLPTPAIVGKKGGKPQ